MRYLIKEAISEHSLQILAIDCSFIPKSGKLTYGLDYFFNSSLGRAEKGLEISVISVIALEANLSYTLSVQQTPPKKLESSDLNVQPQSHFRQENSRFPTTSLTSTNTAPKASKAHQSSSKKTDHSIDISSNQRKKITENTESTRIDVYLAHLKKTKPYVPATIKYLVADGYYSKEKFVKGVLELNFSLIGKLRKDANLRYLYTGQQKQRGARRKYDGKVDFMNLERLTFVKEINSNIFLYTAIVNHVTLNRTLRIVYILDRSHPTKTREAILFSTDTELEAYQIYCYYKARFQIEFIFRDAKQFTGLCDCQARAQEKLDFHFNASLTALNPIPVNEIFKLHQVLEFVNLF